MVLPIQYKKAETPADQKQASLCSFRGCVYWTSLLYFTVVQYTLLVLYSENTALTTEAQIFDAFNSRCWFSLARRFPQTRLIFVVHLKALIKFAKKEVVRAEEIIKWTLAQELLLQGHALDWTSMLQFSYAGIYICL